MAERRPERSESPNLGEVEQRLRAEAARLREEIGTMEAHGMLDGGIADSLEELSAYDNHPADLATESFERSKDIGLRDNLRIQLRQVERAQERLAAGLYGKCEVCGAPIDPERLEAEPWATTCVPCQQELDDELDTKSRPIEEGRIGMAFGQDTGGRENNAWDGEDTWQAVARYGAANSPQDVPDAVNYDETFFNADEDIGLVELTDALIDPSQGGIESGELTEDLYSIGRHGQRRTPHKEEFRGADE
ncbi:MAG: TraR/DksA C4-type zinc finger protein [Chitinophagales bacterium]